MADEIMSNIYLVNAPAGSGKTTKIRCMVETHLREKPDDNILCITYTNRAADELAKDIESPHVFFGTIHSFINNFISSFFSHKAIIDLYWELYGEKIKERIDNIEQKDNISESNQRFIEKYGQLDLDTVYNNIHSISYNEAPYNSLYRGALSHDDLISFTRIAVDKFPIIKRKIADKYQLIFIDEYQDTSAEVLHIFYETMKNSGSGKLYLLGDKMQQIYKTYDGSFEKEFLTLNHSINLTTNYRTTPHIVSILNNIYNDKTYKQDPYGEKKDTEMSFLPEVIITDTPDVEVNKKTNVYPDSLILYLLNKKRFYSIGAGTIYEAVLNMEKYGYGKKYGVVDILTSYDNNPDNLFSLLFLFMQMDLDYRNALYGKVLKTIKGNTNILNASKYEIKRHSDKRIVKNLLESVLCFFENGNEKIVDFLNYSRELDAVNSELIDEIIADKDYANVLDVLLGEFHNLVKYLQNPHISTQHGVKGESHDTVIFVAANSSHDPIVYMNKFLRLWCEVDVNLPEFETFYYDYKKFLVEIEKIIGVKPSDMKKDDYIRHEIEVYQKMNDYFVQNSSNLYFVNLLQPIFETYLNNKGVTKLRDCLKENIVYGSLSAYKLFYVGCSRARKNLSIIIDRNDVQGFEEKVIEKFKKSGFGVVKNV